MKAILCCIRSFLYGIILPICCLITSDIQAEEERKTLEQRVDFIQAPFDDVMKQAYDQGRFLFVHTTSGNCSSCDLLANILYKDNRVADFLNSNFLNYKMNVDDQRFLNFARIHNLGQTPVMLFFNAKNNIVTKAIGIRNPEELLSAGEEVLQYRFMPSEDDLANFDNMEREYYLGNRNPDFLYDFAYTLKAFNEPYNSVVNEYLRKLSKQELKLTKNRKLIYDFSDNLENDAVEYFILDIEHYKEVIKGPQINERIKTAIYNSVITAVRERDINLFNKILNVLNRVHIPDKEAFAFHLVSEFYEGTRDWSKYAENTIRYFDAYDISDPYLLNNAAYKFYRYVNDKKQLKQAVKWVEESVDIDYEYYNNFTYALLLARLDRCREALAAVNTAIDIAQIRENIDYADAARLQDTLKSRNCD